MSQHLASPLTIGHGKNTVTLHSRVLQSPLSGVTDLVFRRLVRRYAPESMMYTEMVQAASLQHLKETPIIMDIDPNERPISIQLFDCRPDFLAEAAVKAVAQGADTIDLNMGCPVNKITKNGGGSSLLRQPELAAQIVREVVDAIEVPVTVKTRIGWDDNEINILEFSQQLQEAGATMITVHARTRAQAYNGPADWDWIRKVKDHLDIPVIANGDIDSVESAVKCLELTGADGVMCSRGTLGYPFLVGEVDYYLKHGTEKEKPTTIQILQCASEHLQMLAEYKGDRGIYQSRKHMTWYCKGFAGANELRANLSQIRSVKEGQDLINNAIQTLGTKI
jgi:tRNA-dihydrouridine synthase B